MSMLIDIPIWFLTEHIWELDLICIIKPAWGRAEIDCLATSEAAGLAVMHLVALKLHA